jgi:hypothetical protein
MELDETRNFAKNWLVAIRAFPEQQLIVIPAGLLQTKFASNQREFGHIPPIRGKLTNGDLFSGFGCAGSVFRGSDRG